MGTTLVNGHVSYQYLTPHDLTLREFKISVAMAMCAVDKESNEVAVSTSTRLARQRSDAVRASVSDPGGLGHRLFRARSLGLGGKSAEGYCKICNDRHASGVFKTCSSGLGSEKPKPYWLCLPGKHGRPCYCQHMHDMLGDGAEQQ